MKYISKTYRLRLAALAVGLTVMATVSAPHAAAFDLSTYCENSVLASGKWVKISVPSNGLYKISRATLKKWGFSDPSKVRVYGYGSPLISDVLSLSNYVDDLPETQSALTSSGDVVFYGVGPDEWSQSVSGRYIATLDIYSTVGYYFITESDEERREIPSMGSAEANPFAATSFNERIHHEEELATPGEAGPRLVGEDFRYTPSRTFNFNLTDNVGSTVWTECSFVALTYDGSSSIAFTANGNAVTSNSTDVIAATTSSSYYYGSEAITRHTLQDITGDKLALTIKYSSSATIYGAWLNYLTVNYERALKMPSTNYLTFWLTSGGALTVNSGTTPTVWDVTNPTNIYKMNTVTDASGRVCWVNDYSGQRAYASFTDTASLPEPTFVSTVKNQNLHAEEPVDMIIFTISTWKDQAEKIAELHRTDSRRPLKVLVVDVNDVYNEFCSGAPNVNALRRMLKMFYDRGKDTDNPLRFALLMGRCTFDNRHLLTATQAAGTKTIPIWLGGTTKQSLNDNDGYSTDDYIAMLGDGSGSDKGLDKLSIAVGRMPVRTVDEAQNAVDKLKQYMNSAPKTGWKNHLLMLADDEDQGVHMTQTEEFLNQLSDDNPFFVNKVYMDAYNKTDGAYPGARQDMFRLLDEGAMWWNFIGHANNHSWTHDGQLTYTDINNMYLKHVPILYAATCDFLRWDSNTLSGGEIFFHERYGGTIATISATRPVYITENGKLSASMGRHLADRDANGRLLTLGEIYQAAKNDIRDTKNEVRSNPNRLRYVLMGNPAMPIATPDNSVVVSDINGVNIDSDDQIIIQALQHAVINGSVTDPEGNILTDFNGTVTATIYDAEYSTTSNGNGEGIQYTFQQHGNKLFAGSAKVVNGSFSLTAPMPSEIADNFREASLNLYAISDDNNTEAVGTENRFYVYGRDESAPVDDLAPSIDSFYLNHESFTDGGVVNTDPMVIATVSDDIAINISTAGIGHQITLRLDDKTTYNDVSEFYTPAQDGSPSGTINYPLDDLTAGDHTLTLRVWDTSSNSVSKTINFTVSEAVAPKIYDIWTDSNPASTQANFYISHDRPDQMLTVTVTVYNLLGQPLWSSTSTGVSDMFTSSPVTWNLTDSAGRRVQRGIYIYRATVTADGTAYETASKKIAVTAY
jgi:hypothetical protein